MGLIDRLFGKPKAAAGSQDSQFETFTAYTPVFTSWGGQIYESELVRAAVTAKARHVAKLQYNMRGTARQKLLTATKTAAPRRAAVPPPGRTTVPIPCST